MANSSKKIFLLGRRRPSPRLDFPQTSHYSASELIRKFQTEGRKERAVGGRPIPIRLDLSSPPIFGEDQLSKLEPRMARKIDL